MGRFMPADYLRLRQVIPGNLNLTFAGAESNVAACVAFLGGAARYVTALPDHTMGKICRDYFHGLGVDVSQCVLRPESRLGMFYVENGVAQRGGQITYDRAHSAFSETPPEAYDWNSILSGAQWFFTTGISPAVSEQACETSLAAVRAARAKGIPVAFDPNHRRTLWRWSKTIPPETLARQTFDRFLPEIDLLFTNGDQAADLLGLSGSGEQTPEDCLKIAREIQKRYPQLKFIALTMRRLHAAHDHSWGAALYEAKSDRLWFAPDKDGQYVPYRITQIIDRLGTGDAFAGGLLYALSCPELAEPGKALAFATANAALAHTIMGDVTYLTRSDVETVLTEGGSGRVSR